jgi:hypothetical protein
MLYKYSDYIKEGGSTSSSAELIYWQHQLDNILGNDWTEISCKKVQDKYQISFKTGSGQYDYYGIILKKGTDDIYYVETPETAKKFTEKFYHEFWENPQLYANNLAYTPKCLGDIQHVKDAEKYNM